MFLLSMLIGDVLGAGSNPRVSGPGVFFGIDIGNHYPEFGVSALRFYTKVVQTSKNAPEDVAIKAVAVVLRGYEEMLNKYYETEEWIEAIKRDLEKLKGATEEETSAYIGVLLERVTKKKPGLEERKELTGAATFLYNELMAGCNLQSSKLMVLEKCDFVEEMPCSDVTLVNRSYSGVAFQEVIAASDRACAGAYALLLDQEEEASRLKSLLNDPYLYRKKFYSKYKYAETPQEGIRAQSAMLLIPRYVKASASTHRLVIVNLIEREDERGVLYNWLQLSYEDVPSQRRSSALFKSAQAEVLRRRKELYGCGHQPESPVDSDGDTNVVKLAVATALAEWLGRGVCAQVGRGGYSTSHEGMVHAFLLLTPESSRLVKGFMDENALGIEEPLAPGGKQFLQTMHDAPYQHLHFLHFLRSNCSVSGYGPEENRREMGSFTYRAVVSNHRQRSMHTSSDRLESEITLLPVRNGVLTRGKLNHRYCIRNFGKHTKNTILRYSSETLPPDLRIMDSPHYRAMRHRAAFEELVLDVDAANAEARRTAEESMRRSSGDEAGRSAEEVGRNAALSKFKDEAARKMADAEKNVEEGTMAEVEYLKLCNDLRDEYRVRAAASLAHH